MNIFLKEVLVFSRNR